MTSSPDKAYWRAEARRTRATATVDSAGHCRALLAFLNDVEQVPGAGHVVVYDALGDEVDLSALVSTETEPGERYAITRTPDAGHRLSVHPLGGPTERHPYGYRQPTADAPTVDDDDIVAVICPGLAFDRHGTRLGRGAGYYDRFLARLGPGVLRIGVTGDQLMDRLPAERFDVAMTHLAFSTGVRPVEPR